MKNNDEKEKEFEVGYCKPPKSRTWKPGQSGNKSGKKKSSPKRPLTFLETLALELQKSITIKENGRRKQSSKMDVMVAQLVNEAIKGNKGFLKFLAALNSRLPPVEDPHLLTFRVTPEQDKIIDAFLNDEDEAYDNPSDPPSDSHDPDQDKS
jgi:hypothetical protein